MLEDLESAPLSLLARTWSLAAALVLLTLMSLYAVMDEPFWCLTILDGIDLLLLPGVAAGGWTTVLLLAGCQLAQRSPTPEQATFLRPALNLRGTLWLLLPLSAACLSVSTACLLGYMADLGRSPALFCGDMPEYGSCFDTLAPPAR